MRRPLRFIALLLPAFALASPLRAADRALVLVQSPPPHAAARLLEQGVMVVRDLERSLLVVAGPGDDAALDRSGSAWRVLDASIEGRTYYTVGVRDEARLRALPGVRVLSLADGEAVIEAAPERALAVSGAGMDLARVFIRPIRVARTAAAPAPPLRAATWDPEIQAVVNAVTGAFVDAGVQRLQNFVTRYATSDSCQAAANWIKQQFEAFGIDSVAFHHWSPTYRDNVVAVIPGRASPERKVVVGGHYDSITGNPAIAPGADDDASGTACVLECARVLAQHEFDCTLVFVAFCAEEQGLLGSEAFAAAAAAQGDDIVAAICVDMIGYKASGDVLDLDVIDNASSLWLRTLAMEVAPLYVPTLPLVDGSLPAGASSDHASFWAQGYDAILLFEDTASYSPYIHTSSDLAGLSYNSPALAAASVKLTAALLATLAQPFRIAIAHEPLPDTGDTVNPIRVTADIVAAQALATDALSVHWSTAFGSGTAPLTPTGTPDEYEGFIPAQPGGVTVEYWLAAEDVSGNRVTDPRTAPAEVHSFFVGAITTVWSDDFETDRGWSAGAPGDNATLGVWVRADPNGTWSGATPVQPEDDHTPAPGVLCWVTGNAPPGSAQGTADVDGGLTTLTSPVLDLSAVTGARVRYHRWYTNDTGAAPETDVWAVDGSTDGGATWARLETLGSSDRTWRLVEHPLAATTSQMRFRFVARDDEPGSIVEAGVDDFSIVSYQQPPTAAPAVVATAERVFLAQSAPNPVRPPLSISFAVPGAARAVTLRVFDLAGRRVATLLRDELAAGVRTVEWSGRDDAGRDAAAGVYFYRLEAGETVLSRKVVLLR